jgi:hypothetical protein
MARFSWSAVSKRRSRKTGEKAIKSGVMFPINEEAQHTQPICIATHLRITLITGPILMHPVSRIEREIAATSGSISLDNFEHTSISL